MVYLLLFECLYLTDSRLIVRPLPHSNRTNRRIDYKQANVRHLMSVLLFSFLFKCLYQSLRTLIIILNSVKRREKDDGGVVKLTREEVRENRVAVSFLGNSTPSLAKDKRTWTISFDKQKSTGCWLLLY